MPGHSPLTRFIALVTVSMLFALSFSTQTATAGTIWHVGPAEFANGTMDNVNLVSNKSALEIRESFLNNWTLRSLGNPYPRDFHTMAYDKTNGEMILFGGYSGYCLGDTWAYNLSSDYWTNRNPSIAPVPRFGHAMVYDSARGEMVLFGGGTDYNDYYNDTWTYNFTVNKWTNKKPSSAPPARAGQSMAYDNMHDEVILFGGRTTYDFFNDTWTYDMGSNNWTKIDSPTNPTARAYSAMDFNGVHEEMVLFGGYDDVVKYEDTWAFNLSTNNWTDRDPSNAPPARQQHTLTYDAANGEMVLFGGWIDEDQSFGDTWTYDLTTNNWANMSPPDAPPARCTHAAAFDSAREEVMLYGGYANNDTLRDIWTYNLTGNNWTKQVQPTTPPARGLCAMSYDERHREMVLFGGGQMGIYHGDTWIYDLDTNNWTNMSPSTSPSAREGSAMVYDSAYGEMVLFGGENRVGTLNDTWTYNLSTNTWTILNPLTSPPTAWNHAMAYDSTHGKVILFGGTDDGNHILHGTWVYDRSANVWTNMNPSPAPPSRNYHDMVYDDDHGEIILFGGLDTDSTCLKDTWTYNLTTNKWSNMDPPTTPSARHDYGMAYVKAHGTVVLFGGSDRNDYLNDTWTYDLSTNDWTNMKAPAAPHIRAGQDMAYDSAHDEVVLFGGIEYEPPVVPLGDTWTYNYWTYFTAGNYSSAPQNTGGIAYFSTMSWDADVPQNTTIRFQFRSADTDSNLTKKEFLGPDGTTNSYYETSGMQLNSVNNGTQWFQYRASLGTSDVTVTPSLRSVTVNYNLLQNISIISPVGGENWTGSQNITWTASDPDNDSLTFSIYLENANASILLISDLPYGTASWVWNTSAVPNGTYRIRMVAADNNSSIPLSIITFSGNFTIFHPPPPPPPNHPPHIELLAPADKSVVNNTTVQLVWLGNDPDGDHLTYYIRYSNLPLSEGNWTSTITQDGLFDLANLADNTTYYWTVDASDGIFNTTDVPAGIWSFTVELPHSPVNHPPRITSIPSTEVMVGDVFNYNVTALDEDGDTLVFSVVNGPLNMSIDSNSGQLQWVPSAGDVGNHTIIVQVSDGRGGVDVQIFTVSVSPRPVPPAPEKPQCAIEYPINGSKVGGRIIIRGTAINGTLPLTIIQVRIDGGDWMTAVGLKNWILTINLGKLKNGGHTIEARAFDGSLYSETASVQFSVANPEPSVSSGGNPFCLPAVIIAVVAGLAILLVLRRKKRGPG